jgi:GNAT superfamily N-acetyltransferase
VLEAERLPVSQLIPPAPSHGRHPATGSHDVRHLGAVLGVAENRRGPGLRLGADGCHLAHRQRVQYICNHLRFSKHHDTRATERRIERRRLWTMAPVSRRRATKEAGSCEREIPGRISRLRAIPTPVPSSRRPCQAGLQPVIIVWWNRRFEKLNSRMLPSWVRCLWRRWHGGRARRDPRPQKSSLRQTLGHYIAGWPRNGDCGVVAELDSPIGAAWCRLLPTDDPGYGFVDPETPEVTIGVVASHRRTGVGRLLLTDLIETARSNGYRAMCLSVEEDNYACRLYQAVGFRSVGRVHNAWTMVMELHRRSETPSWRVGPLTL